MRGICVDAAERSRANAKWTVAGVAVGSGTIIGMMILGVVVFAFVVLGTYLLLGTTWSEELRGYDARQEQARLNDMK